MIDRDFEEAAQIVSPIQQIINFITENYEKDNEPRQLSMMLLKKWIELKLLDEESKWQQERMYSEKDMKQFAFECVANFLSNDDNKIEIKLVDIILDRNSKKFEQFKKK